MTVKTKREPVRVNVAHMSMQFSDNAEQKRADAAKLFERFRKRNVRWITGTEASSTPNRDLHNALQANCIKYGYRFYRPPGTDCWIAVDRQFIRGKYDTYYQKVLDGKAGQFSDKGVVAVSFEAGRNLGVINVLAAHYLTKGTPSGGAERRVNLDENEKYTKALSAYGAAVGRGKALSFLGADGNIVDRINDVMLGNPPFVTCWDELEKWPNTGHGNIDFVARSSRDGRSSFANANVLDDTEFSLHADHWLVEVGVDILPLRSAA